MKKKIKPTDEHEMQHEDHEIDLDKALKNDPDFEKKYLDGPNKKAPMRGANDFCSTCDKFVGDGFKHLEQNPSHNVFTDKAKALAAKEKR